MSNKKRVFAKASTQGACPFFYSYVFTFTCDYLLGVYMSWFARLSFGVGVAFDVSRSWCKNFLFGHSFYAYFFMHHNLKFFLGQNSAKIYNENHNGGKRSLDCVGYFRLFL